VLNVEIHTWGWGCNWPRVEFYTWESESRAVGPDLCRLALPERSEQAGVQSRRRSFDDQNLSNRIYWNCSVVLLTLAFPLTNPKLIGANSSPLGKKYTFSIVRWIRNLSVMFMTPTWKLDNIIGRFSCDVEFCKRSYILLMFSRPMSSKYSTYGGSFFSSEKISTVMICGCPSSWHNFLIVLAWA